MWARWELRRTQFTEAYDVQNRYYPTRFLELKGIEVPSVWAREFASQFFLNDLVEVKKPGGFFVLENDRRDARFKELYRRAVEHYETQTTSPSAISFIDMNPQTYVHYTVADVPTGTTVHESKSDLVITQAGTTVRLKKPLTKNLFSMLAAVKGKDVFLPLVTKEKTFILHSRGAHMIPYELTAFDTKSGERLWETVGWSAWPIKVEVFLGNMLTPGEEETLWRTLVGEIKVPGPDNDPGRGDGWMGRASGACCWYLTATERTVSVFGSEGVLLSVETFDNKTGRNVLRFATDYHGDEAQAARRLWRDGSSANETMEGSENGTGESAGINR